jgi:hypothetical protein
MTTIKDDINAIQKSYPKISRKTIIKLRKIAYKLQELNLSYCNGKNTDKEEIETNALEMEAKEIERKYNIKIEINNDPRGFPIKILNTKRTNSFLGEGWGLGK